jgi:hypothetical protein
MRLMPKDILISASDQHVPFGTGMCQPKSIMQVIDFEEKQKRRPQHLAFCFSSLSEVKIALISVSLKS